MYVYMGREYHFQVFFSLASGLLLPWPRARADGCTCVLPIAVPETQASLQPMRARLPAGAAARPRDADFTTSNLAFCFASLLLVALRAPRTAIPPSPPDHRSPPIYRAQTPVGGALGSTDVFAGSLGRPLCCRSGSCRVEEPSSQARPEDFKNASPGSVFCGSEERTLDAQEPPRRRIPRDGFLSEAGGGRRAATRAWLRRARCFCYWCRTSTWVSRVHLFHSQPPHTLTTRPSQPKKPVAWIEVGYEVQHSV